jgi:hypothetical protein
MRRRHAPVKDRAVPRATEPAAPLRVVLSLDLAEEPVGGTLTQAQRPSRTFSGWFELIGFLEDAVRAARNASIDTQPGSTFRQSVPKGLT